MFCDKNIIFKEFFAKENNAIHERLVFAFCLPSSASNVRLERMHCSQTSLTLRMIGMTAKQWRTARAVDCRLGLRFGLWLRLKCSELTQEVKASLWLSVQSSEDSWFGLLTNHWIYWLNVWSENRELEFKKIQNEIWMIRMFATFVRVCFSGNSPKLWGNKILKKLKSERWPRSQTKQL